MNWWAPIIIGCCSLCGAFGGIALKQLWDNRLAKKKTLFNVYMSLMELLGLYWGETVAEFHKQNPDRVQRDKIARLTWTISDRLRLIDETTYTDEILTVLFSKEPDKYPTAQSRYEAIENIVHRLGEYVNPNHQKIMKEISDNNQRVLVNQFKDGIPKEGIKDNAPASFMFQI